MIYTDLKHHYGFDLIEYVAGRTMSSTSTITAMLRRLPEDAAFTIAMADKYRGTGSLEPLDPETEAAMDRHFWTPDRQLSAQIINALRDLTKVTAKWEKDPGFPVIGPASWRAETAKPGQPQASNNGTSVDDVFNKMMGR